LLLLLLLCLLWGLQNHLDSSIKNGFHILPSFPPQKKKKDKHQFSVTVAADQIQADQNHVLPPLRVNWTLSILN